MCQKGEKENNGPRVRIAEKLDQGTGLRYIWESISTLQQLQGKGCERVIITGQGQDMKGAPWQPYPMRPGPCFPTAELTPQRGSRIFRYNMLGGVQFGQRMLDKYN